MSGYTGDGIVYSVIVSLIKQVLLFCAKTKIILLFEIIATHLH